MKLVLPTFRYFRHWPHVVHAGNAVADIPVGGSFFCCLARQKDRQARSRVGSSVLQNPQHFVMGEAASYPGEEPFYFIVRLNKLGRATYYCFGRGFDLDMLYVAWKDRHEEATN